MARGKKFRVTPQHWCRHSCWWIYGLV